MKFTCPHCEKVLNVKDEYAGRKAKCPGCGESIVIEAPAEAEPANEPEAAAPAPAEEQSDQQDEEISDMLPSEDLAELDMKSYHKLVYLYPDEMSFQH